MTTEFENELKSKGFEVGEDDCYSCAGGYLANGDVECENVENCVIYNQDASNFPAGTKSKDIFWHKDFICDKCLNDDHVIDGHLDMDNIRIFKNDVDVTSEFTIPKALDPEEIFEEKSDNESDESGESSENESDKSENSVEIEESSESEEEREEQKCSRILQKGPGRGQKCGKPTCEFSPYCSKHLG